MDGWIKLWRKTLESDMYQSLNSVQRDVMITCLLLANHTGKKWEWKGKVFEAKPGQFITSLQSLKDRCAKDVSIQNIRTALKKLESWEFLTSESTKTGRLVTVVNWATYQHTEEELTKAPTKNQQSANKQLTTTKNDKNGKNDKNRDNAQKSIIPANLGEDTRTPEEQLATKLRDIHEDHQTVTYPVKSGELKKLRLLQDDFADDQICQAWDYFVGNIKQFKNKKNGSLSIHWFYEKFSDVVQAMKEDIQYETGEKPLEF